jgi:tRNA(Arg) A34 adenosine deaminase TadA
MRTTRFPKKKRMDGPQLEHDPFIRKAIELAIASGKKGNDTFGAVLVHEGAIIATAENTQNTG